ncbi:hypothetical protein C8R47DRAFT_1270540 [Mycena vitilis]|nr:hypothetical protein C8R47DRAFT_1270540 [Mycena vitilis]
MSLYGLQEAVKGHIASKDRVEGDFDEDNLSTFPKLSDALFLSPTLLNGGDEDHHRNMRRDIPRVYSAPNPNARVAKRSSAQRLIPGGMTSLPHHPASEHFSKLVAKRVRVAQRKGKPRELVKPELKKRAAHQEPISEMRCSRLREERHNAAASGSQKDRIPQAATVRKQLKSKREAAGRPQATLLAAGLDVFGPTDKPTSARESPPATRIEDCATDLAGGHRILAQSTRISRERGGSRPSMFVPGCAMHPTGTVLPTMQPAGAELLILFVYVPESSALPLKLLHGQRGGAFAAIVQRNAYRGSEDA